MNVQEKVWKMFQIIIHSHRGHAINIHITPIYNTIEGSS